MIENPLLFMKIVAIGDIHGRTLWKKILEKESPDVMVVMGDYFDSRENISQQAQMENFAKLVALKENRPGGVCLLFGNHDGHYLPGWGETYSGYNPVRAIEIGAMLRDAVLGKQVQMAFSADLGFSNVLFSHAGVSRTWLANTKEKVPYDEKETDLPGYLNDLLCYKPDAFRFTPGSNRFDRTGDSKTQPPTWIRPETLMQDAIHGFVQVVGHTASPDLLRLQSGSATLYTIDTLGTSGEYLMMREEGILIKK